MNCTVAISVSTTYHRINYLEKFLESNHKALSKFDEVILIIQGKTDKNVIDELLQRHSFIFYYLEEKLGISSSRNLGLRVCRSSHIWFMDDDTIIDEDAYDEILSAINKENSEALLFQIECSNANRLYKKYRNIKNQKLLAVNASSIEIVVDISFLVKEEIYFQENMGIGTSINSSEENFFLLDIVNAGGKIRREKKVIVKHPCGEKHRKDCWSQHGVIAARAIIARKVGGLLGFIICLRWCYLYFKVSGIRFSKLLFLEYLKDRGTNFVKTK
ncbi:MAG: glycosyltransferase [Candidatus Electrothrix sp. AW2]|nr:glycosyltransferase [Candidatus Electrothrix gigas]